MDLSQQLRVLNDREIPLCMFFNRMNRRRHISAFFGVISKLGDGPVWYLFAAINLIVFGQEAWMMILHMAVVCVPTILIYKWLKKSTSRVRPYAYDHSIRRSVAALDQFSFPSGHTMHAVGFSTVILHHQPHLVWLFLPFTILVALSRVILGLHYPTDVIFGALLGYLLAIVSIAVVPV